MKKSLILAGLLVLTATSAFAEQPGTPPADGPRIRQMAEFYFVQMDANGDGFVTKDEARAFADKMFDEADTKHDGKLTIDELVDQKMRERDAFKTYQGKNTSDTSNAAKVKSN